ATASPAVKDMGERLGARVFGPALEDVQTIGRNIQGGLTVIDGAIKQAHQVTAADVAEKGRQVLGGAGEALEEQRTQRSALDDAWDIIGTHARGEFGEGLAKTAGLATRMARSGSTQPE